MKGLEVEEHCAMALFKYVLASAAIVQLYACLAIYQY